MTLIPFAIDRLNKGCTCFIWPKGWFLFENIMDDSLLKKKKKIKKLQENKE